MKLRKPEDIPPCTRCHHEITFHSVTGCHALNPDTKTFCGCEAFCVAPNPETPREGCSVPMALQDQEAQAMLQELATMDGPMTPESLSWAREECLEPLHGFQRDALAALEEWAGSKQGGPGVMRSGAILGLRTLLETVIGEEITRIRLATAHLEAGLPRDESSDSGNYGAEKDSG